MEMHKQKVLIAERWDDTKIAQRKHYTRDFGLRKTCLVKLDTEEHARPRPDLATFCSLGTPLRRHESRGHCGQWRTGSWRRVAWGWDLEKVIEAELR